MAKKETLTDRLKKPKRLYTKEDLEKFNESVMRYKKQFPKSGGGFYEAIDWDEIYLKIGIKTKGKPGYHDSVVVQLMSNGKYYIPLEEFENKREQWDFWRNGIDWVEQQKLKGLDQSYSKEDHEFDHYNDPVEK